MDQARLDYLANALAIQHAPLSNPGKVLEPVIGLTSLDLVELIRHAVALGPHHAGGFLGCGQMQVDADDVRSLARKEDSHGAAVADALADRTCAQKQNFLAGQPARHPPVSRSRPLRRTRFDRRGVIILHVI